MNLSKIKNDLRQVLQLVEDWHEKGVADLERDLALEKLREIYSTLRFGMPSQPETISAEEESGVDEESAKREEEQISAAELEPTGIAISLDDVFDDFIPENLIPESVDIPLEEERTKPLSATQPDEGEPAEVAAYEQLEQESEQGEEEPMVGAEDPKEEEYSYTEQPDEVLIEESTSEPTTEPDEVLTEKRTPEPTPEHVTKSVVESAAEPERAMEQPSLFGDEELFVPRTSRRSRMMSLYNEEPAVISFPNVTESKAEPNVFPVEEIKPSKSVVTPEPEPESAEVAKMSEQETSKRVEIPTEEERFRAESVGYEEDEEELVEIDIERLEESAEELQEISEEVEQSPQNATPYIEPQIEVAIATPATSVAPEPEQVLGEVIKNNVQTIADRIKPKDTAAEQIVKGSVDDIAKAVGINDKFLLIRDLFGGSSTEYERVMAQLNGFDNLDDCMIYIVENFDWNPNSDGAKLIMELLERKYN